jgi:hypothetical protein
MHTGMLCSWVEVRRKARDLALQKKKIVAESKEIIREIRQNLVRLAVAPNGCSANDDVMKMMITNPSSICHFELEVFPNLYFLLIIN